MQVDAIYSPLMDFSYVPLPPDPITTARRAAALNPTDPAAHNRLANLLYEAGRFTEAADAFAAASRLQPGDALARGNHGIALAKAGRAQEAVPILEDAARMLPTMPEIFHNLGNAYRLLYRLSDAARSYEQAIELRPDYAEAHWNHSLVLLLDGKLVEGWDDHEWRHWLKGRKPLPLMGPAWTGHLDVLPGKSIVLMAEQGFGDTIQFCRYCKVLADAGAKVVLVCQPELKSLMTGLPGVAHLAAGNDRVVRFDLSAPLMSVPRLLRTGLQSIPSQVPYLHADESKRAMWRERFSAHTGTRKIGLVWAGRPTHLNDANRSIKLTDFLPLAALQGVTWFSLQKGPAAEQLKSPPFPMVDLANELQDFSDTAAAIAELDLVISVDTAVVHLAGALGKPVWNLLPHVPDWRWLLHRDDSPWYPTMRLFRQLTPGDWGKVMQAVSGALPQS